MVHIIKKAAPVVQDMLTDLFSLNKKSEVPYFPSLNLKPVPTHTLQATACTARPICISGLDYLTTMPWWGLPQI